MVVPGSRKLTLPRTRRIKHRRDFAKVKAEGKRVAYGCLAANWLPLDRGQPSRLGVITGRRLGSAVQRNRARRLLREAFRLHQRDLKGPLDLVLIARPSIVEKKLPDVESDFLNVLSRSRLLKRTQ
jgi:ribonuclease P protein component